jgi:hypothetical protein
MIECLTRRAFAPALWMIAAASSGFAGVTAAQQQTVRIGLAGPLSGSSAHSGKDNENGARLAIEDLNRTPITTRKMTRAIRSRPPSLR